MGEILTWFPLSSGAASRELPTPTLSACCRCVIPRVRYSHHRHFPLEEATRQSRDPRSAGLTAISVNRSASANTQCCTARAGLPNAPCRDVIRDGQKANVCNGSRWTLTGKSGPLTIRTPQEWVDPGSGGCGVAFGTWKVTRGTGQYAGITGGGRSAYDAHCKKWYARHEGFLTPSRRFHERRGTTPPSHPSCARGGRAASLNAETSWFPRPTGFPAPARARRRHCAHPPSSGVCLLYRADRRFGGFVGVYRRKWVAWWSPSSVWLATVTVSVGPGTDS